MSVSIGLTLYELAGISLSRISILGNSVDVQRPSVLTALIWVVWLYFVVRAWQTVDLGPLRSAVNARLVENIGSELVAAGSGQLLASIEAEEVRVRFENLLATGATPVPMDIAVSPRRSWRAIEARCAVQLHYWDRDKMTWINEKLLTRAGPPSGELGWIRHEFTGFGAVRVWLRSLWSVAWMTPYATGLVLPFAIALGPLLALFLNVTGLAPTLTSPIASPGPASLDAAPSN
jgi:hypothetical protein